MGNTEDPGDVEAGNRQTLGADPRTPRTVLEQTRLGNLDLFRTELESGNHPLDFKAGRDIYFNRTPLHLAAMEGHDEIVEFILSHPEISREVVNAKDSFGYTPLHLAVRHSHENVVRLLVMSSLVLPDKFLAATSDPDDLGLNHGGFTPLHFAAVGGHIDIARLLLRQPCQVEFAYDPVNIFALNWYNSTPLDLARQNKFRNLGDFLEASDLNCLHEERASNATSANAILVGAALVAAAAFSSWLQPPGGMPNPDSEAPLSPSVSDSSSSPSRTQYSIFYLCVTFAFAFSVLSLGTGILAASPYRGASLKVDLRLLRRTLNIARRCLVGALVFLVIAFSAAGTFVVEKVTSRNDFVGTIGAALPPFTIGYLFVFYLYWA